MIYKLDDPDMGIIIDKYVTGNYGEDEYGLNEGCMCSCCGAEISSGEAYYDVDGTFYCKECEEEAKEDILERVIDRYIFEC